MKKFRFVITGILCCFIISLCFCMPKIIETISGTSGENSITAYDVKPVSFQRSESDPLKTMNILSDLLSSPETVQKVVLSNGNNYTADSITECATDCIYQFLSYAFDYSGIDFTYIGADGVPTSTFYIDSSDPTKNAAIWTVNYTINESEMHITLIMDDSSGMPVGMEIYGNDISYWYSVIEPLFLKDTALYAFSSTLNSWVDYSEAEETMPTESYYDGSDGAYSDAPVAFDENPPYDVTYVISNDTSSAPLNVSYTITDESIYYIIGIVPERGL